MIMHNIISTSVRIQWRELQFVVATTDCRHTNRLQRLDRHTTEIIVGLLRNGEQRYADGARYTADVDVNHATNALEGLRV